MHPYGIIIPVSLVLGLGAGAVMHRSDFCMAGMFRDFFLFRNPTMLRFLFLLVAVSMVLFEGARQAGLLTLYPFPILGSPSLANVIGGFVFGIGMVLAGGCVVGTLYKMGSGNVLSMLAFGGLILGSGLYAEIHPWWSGFARSTGFFPGTVTLPQLMGLDAAVVILPMVLVGGVILFQWYRQGKWTRRSHARGYLQPWKASLILAGIGLVSYMVVGMPMGITTAYAKMAAYLETIVMPDHVAGNGFFQAVPLDYRDPITGTRLLGGAGPRMDAIAAIQFPLIGGIVLGSALSALAIREFRPYYRVPLRQYGSALTGGILLGLASRMSPSCNVWHLLGGLPLLALQSILFLAGLFPGAWMGSLLLKRVVLEQ